MAKILAISDYGHTGINESLKHPLQHWHHAGHEIWQLAMGFNGWSQSASLDEYPWRDRLMAILANPADQRQRFGSACLHEAVKLAKPDIVITSYDVWMVAYLCAPHQDPIVTSIDGALDILHHDKREFVHCMYFPMDGLVQDKYVPRRIDEWIAGADMPVTYSKYAQEAVLRSTGLYIPFIGIGHDAQIFKPGTAQEKAATRAKFEIADDRFVVSMVGTNQYRKRFDEFLEACAIARERVPNLTIVPWTTWDQMIYGGYEITDLVVRYGLEDCTLNPGKNVGRFTDKEMAEFYRACDVNVLTTIGEGAGLPPLRARACGVPALVSANTSNTEFIGHPYEAVRSFVSHTDNGSAIARFSTDVNELAEKIVELAHNEKLRNEIGEAGAAAMYDNYRLERILPMWDALLESMV